jgi:hypothetical protein
MHSVSSPELPGFHSCVVKGDYSKTVRRKANNYVMGPVIGRFIGPTGKKAAIPAEARFRGGETTGSL